MKDKQKIFGLVEIDKDYRENRVNVITYVIYLTLFAMVGATTIYRTMVYLYPFLLIRLFVLFLILVGSFMVIYLLVLILYPRYNKVEIKK